MRNIRLNHTCEHRFVFGEGEEPQAIDGDAFPVTDPVDVPDTELKAQVWRIQRGAVISAHEREADKLMKLQDADGIPYAIQEGDELAELPVVQAPDPTDPAGRTPREEAERDARDAGHTPEGELEDHDRHREYARRSGFEAGGPAAPAVTPGRAAPPAAASRPSPAATAGRSSPSPQGPAGAPTPPQAPAPGGWGGPPPPGASAQPQPPQPAPQPSSPPPPGVGPGAEPGGIVGPLGAPIGPAASAAQSAPQSQPRAAPGPAPQQAPSPGQRTNVDIQGTMTAQPAPAPNR